jgi:hypothetical protein
MTGPAGGEALKLVTDNFMVAMGDNNNSIAYSYDGLGWTSVTNSKSILNIGYGVAWNGSMWVGVGGGDNTIAYSSDGIHWTPSVSNPFQQTLYPGYGYRVAWNGYMWIAVGYGTNTIAYSYNGQVWTGIGNTIFSDACFDIQWNGSIWVAVGRGTNTIAYSYDGINWFPGIGYSFGYEGAGIAWNGSLWVAVGSNSYPDGVTAFSYDGIHWQSGASLGSAGFCIAWNGSIFVTLGYSNNGATSSDGITWDTYTTSIMLDVFDVTWNGSLWVATGTGTYGNTIMASPDGIAWNGLGSGIFDNIGYGIASRRTLPYVGETVVPPILHQATGPTGGAVVFTSPTGTNNMYYSRFLSVTERSGTGTLGINGSVQIGPSGTISSDVSGNLILNTSLLPATGYAYDLGSTGMPWKELYVGTGSVHIGPTGTLSADQSGNVVISAVNGLYLLDLSGNIVSQVYDTNFNVPAGGTQTLSQSGNTVTLSGGSSVNIGQTTDVSLNTIKLTATTFIEAAQSSHNLDTTNFSSVVEINNALYTGHPIEIRDGSGTLTLDVDNSGNASIFTSSIPYIGYSTATTVIGCVSSHNAVTIGQDTITGEYVDQLVVGRPTSSGILLQSSRGTADQHGYIRMNSTTGTEVLSLGAGDNFTAQITLNRAAGGSVSINGPATIAIYGTSTAINTTNTTIGGTLTQITSPTTTISGELIMINPVIKSDVLSNIFYWAYCPSVTQITAKEGSINDPSGTILKWILPSIHNSGQTVTDPMDSNGYFTVPVSGLYSIITNVNVNGFAPNEFLEFCISNFTTGQVLSFDIINTLFNTGGSTVFSVSMSAIALLNSQDKICVRAGDGLFAGNVYVNSVNYTTLIGLTINLLTAY